MENPISETELRTIVRDWQVSKRTQPLKDHKLKVASAYAYLLGAFLSDGTLNWAQTDPHPQWQVNDKYFADCISIALHTIGSPHSMKIKDTPWSCWNSRPKSYLVKEKTGGKLGWWLDDVAPDKSCLPRIPRELVRPLVAGLIDGDGGIYKSPKDQYRLHYTGKDEFVEDFFSLLESSGVQIHDSTYHLNSQVSLSIETFLKAGLCFAMYRKQRHLVGWCRKSIKKAKSRGWEADLRKAAVAIWYLGNANHLKGGWSSASERIPIGCMTYQAEV